MDQNRFDKWMKTHEWRKPNTRTEDFTRAWVYMEMGGMKPEQITDVLDGVIYAMRDEYGE